MVDVTDMDFPKALHNFGIFKKSGKRAILQFDFRNNKLHIIQQGLIKYSFDFEQLLQYESEEGLHLILKFVNKDFEFDAGSTEEKHTICRLLGMVLYGGENLDLVSFEASSPVVKETDKEFTLRRAKSVIKEGILEKKGNTAIPVWAKRLVRVTPGEFSYFRPGEEVALNIIHLWKDDCKIKIHGSCGFAVHLSNRTYYFKVPGEFKRKDKEVERSEWISAFERACKLKRATVMMFGSEGGISHPVPVNMDRDIGMNLQPINNLNPTLMRAVNSRSFDDEFSKDTEFYDRNYTDTDDSIDNSDDDTEDPDYNDIIIENESQFQNNDAQGYESTRVPNGFPAGSYKENTQTDHTTDEPNNIRLSIVMKTVPLPSLTKDRPKPPKQQSFSDRHKNVCKPSQPEIPEVDYINNIEVSSASSEDAKPIITQTEDIVKEYDKENEITYKKPQDVAEVSQDIRGQCHPSPLTIPLPQVEDDYQISVPPPPVPPPPLLHKKSVFRSKNISKRKLKQVHWNSVPKGMIHQSFWYKSPDLTDKINKEQLEMLFSVTDTTTVPQSPAGIKKDKEPLIDGRRAQNLSILMKGLETQGTKTLCSILNSVEEDEHFPAEKLTTIRRYQPTQDEVEMYKMYSNRRHELHPVDQFMLQLCEIKCLSIRLDLVLILWDFPRQMTCVSQTVENLVKACNQLLRSKTIVAVLHYILAIGNYMNSRYHKLDKGFQLTSCERFLGIRGGDGKYTLLHFLIDQLTASDPQLLNWTDSVSAVRSCQNCSVKALSAEIQVLKSDLNKMKKDLKTLKSELKTSTQNDINFCKNAQKMLTEREAELDQLTSKSNAVQHKYHNVLEKYGESLFLPSDQFFSSVSRFIDQFDSAKTDCSKTMPIT